MPSLLPSANLVALLLFTTATGHAGDWPTWRHDSARGAHAPEALPEAMSLHWHRQLPAPSPAFHDVRLQFDRGPEPVAKDGRLFLASSRTDSVTAYGTRNGEILWTHHVNGPVRLAPIAWRDRVLFGSDDGFFYCLSASDGSLIWKKQAVPSNRRLLGNRRLISVWPVRGGPVIHKDRVYFAAGVWPFEGVFIYCLDAGTGQRIWLNDGAGFLYGQQPHNAVAIGGIAPQGYLLIDGDDLVVPSSNAYPGRFDLETGKLKEFNLPGAGRYPGGWFASLSEPSKDPAKAGRRSLLADLGINVVRHEDRMRSVGKPDVRATIRAGSREFRFTNGFPNVTGTIHSMIAADDRLFVTTTEGGLFCFGAKTPGLQTRRFTQPGPPENAKPSALAAAILGTVESRHGHAVLLGVNDAATIEDLIEKTRLKILVVEEDVTVANQLRRRLIALGHYGDRVSVWREKPDAFAMPPWFADLVVVDQSLKLSATERARVFKSVRPYGGKMLIVTTNGIETASREGPLPGASNYEGDFSSSADELVKAPLGVLWFDDTLSHFKRSPQPRFIDGVMVSNNKDWLDASTRKGGVDYRLQPAMFSDVYTGRQLESEETEWMKLQSYARTDTTTIQPSQYRPPTQTNDWKPGAPKAGTRRNPLTGEEESRTFPKSYGCDGGFDYGHIYTMRSGTAAFYDKRAESGTINISGPRSGCSNSVIPANGVLNVPYFYKGCTCSYPLPTGLALYSLPPSHEQWATWDEVPAAKLSGKIQRVGINLGAPGDRMTDDGTLWLEHPNAGGPSPRVRVETTPANPGAYYHHSVWIKGGQGWPWVAASGVEDLRSLTVHGLKPGRYLVRLVFAEPGTAERRFDVELQGRKVLTDFSPARTAGGHMKAVTLPFPNITSSGTLTVNLTARAGKTQLSGLEIIPSNQGAAEPLNLPTRE